MTGLGGQTWPIVTLINVKDCGQGILRYQKDDLTE